MDKIFKFNTLSQPTKYPVDLGRIGVNVYDVAPKWVYQDGRRTDVQATSKDGVPRWTIKAILTPPPRAAPPALPPRSRTTRRNGPRSWARRPSTASTFPSGICQSGIWRASRCAAQACDLWAPHGSPLMMARWNCDGMGRSW